MTRFRRATLAGTLLALAGGCGRPAPRPTAVVVVALAPPAGTAEAAPRDFLAALNAGTAKPEQLTPEFREALAPHAFSEGHADEIVAAWLGQFRGKIDPATAGPLPGATGDAAGFVGANYAVRMARSGAAWKADWLAVTPPGVARPHNFAPGGPGAFAAVAFLSALVGQDDALAAALMTPALKASLAPPFDSDTARGYNAGLMRSRLAQLQVAGTEARLIEIDGATATAAIASPKLDSPRTLRLRFAPGPRPFDWLVDAINPAP